MKTCNTCRANCVCDHDYFGFEDCGNYIPENIFKRLFRWIKTLRKRKHKQTQTQASVLSEQMQNFFSQELIDGAVGLSNDKAFLPRKMNTGAKVEWKRFEPLPKNAIPLSEEFVDGKIVVLIKDEENGTN